MFDYNKLKKVFEDKLFHEQYKEITDIFKVYLKNGNSCKVLLNCLKEASLEIRKEQTIESLNKEASMLTDIVKEALENGYLVYTDKDYIENYVEDYRKIGNN